MVDMKLNFVTFNQDQSMVALGTSKGFRQYTTEPLTKSFASNEGDVSILEMLFSTSLVGLVMAPRQLRIVNTKRQSMICELTFPTRVLAVRMNRKRIIVVLEDEIFVYDITNMHLLSQIPTSPNPQAIAALSSSSENNYLAYPLPQKAAPASHPAPAHVPPGRTAGHVAPTSGEVMVHDLSTDTKVNVIEAHQTPLSCIALNSTSTLLATASEKGTIIRVFGLPNAEKLYQFRRGSIPARIFSMNFNLASTLLAVSSDTETVHIFRLGTPPASPTSATGDADKSSLHSRRRSVTSIEDRDRSVSPGGSEDFRDDADSSSFSPSQADSDRPKPLNPSWQSMFRRTSQNVGKSFATKLGGYLPTTVTEMWEPSRDFAWVKVKKKDSGHAEMPSGQAPTPANNNAVKSVIALSPNHPKLMIATNEGQFLVYRIDLEKGGEGVLEEMHDLMDVGDKLGRSALED